MKRPTLISFCLLSLFVSPLYGQQPRAGAISFEPYSLKTYDQQEHPAELGKLWVPENRGKSNSRLIQLGFVRLKSTAANPQPPIVFLAGGPGVPGIGMARVPIYFRLFERLQAIADVILLVSEGRDSPRTYNVRRQTRRYLPICGKHVKRPLRHWRG